MHSKRKIIKKQFIAPKDTDAENHDTPENIAEQLQSEDLRVKLDGVAALANLQQLDEQLQTPSILIELINILHTGDHSLINACLFAINNICQLNPESLVPTLFKQGLDKALMQLNSNDEHLIKPIIILMTTICSYTPEPHQCFIKAVQNTIMTGKLPTSKSNPNPNPFLNPDYAEIVLQFLMRSEYAFDSAEYPPNQPAIVECLISLSESHSSFKMRAMAARVLIGLTRANCHQHIDIFCDVSEEILTDLNLQKQYMSNFIGNEEMNEKEVVGVGEGGMEEQKKNKGKRVTINDQSYNQLLDALQGVRIVLQFSTEVLQNEKNFEDEEEQDEGQMEQQEMDQQQQIENEENKGEWNQALIPKITQHIQKNCKLLQKFINFSFTEGQIIVELVLKLILAFPNNAKTQEINQFFVFLSEQCLVGLMKGQMIRHQIPIEYLSLNTNLCLQIILKYKQIKQRQIYIELPTLAYQDGNRIMTIEHIWKDCWMSLLEIYSTFFNPDKNAVGGCENLAIGQTLKQLIIQIPEMELEEWRGQAIDTLFDVYSNENFDQAFMELGFLPVLDEVLKTVSGKKQKQLKKKSNKFINAVIADIHRFIEYKKKMIGL